MIVSQDTHHADLCWIWLTPARAVESQTFVLRLVTGNPNAPNSSFKQSSALGSYAFGPDKIKSHRPSSRRIIGSIVQSP